MLLPARDSLGCPGLGASAVAGVAASDEFGPEGCSGMVDAEPRGSVKSTTRF